MLFSILYWKRLWFEPLEKRVFLVRLWDGIILLLGNRSLFSILKRNSSIVQEEVKNENSQKNYTRII